MTQQQALKRLDEGATDFDTWYVAQYGARPARRSLDDLWREVYALRQRLSEAEIRHDEVLAWERRRDAALKGWEARSSREGVRS